MALAKVMEIEGNRVDSWSLKEDSELVELIKDGSHYAFGVLVRRHTDKFYRLAFRYLGDKDLAEDIVQDAFLKFWERPDKWSDDKETKFTTWFYKVVVNQCLDFIKKKKPLPVNDDLPVADERPIHDEEIELLEQQKLLEKAMNSIPERQRTAINLCFYEQLSNKEAADIMGINLKALQSLIMRGKEGLKEQMKGYL